MNESTIIESAGLYGKSEIHYLDSSDWKVTLSTKMDSKFFAEGCAKFNNLEN